MPAFNFAYKGNVDAGAVAAGQVQIRATVGATKTVVFDSGEIDLAPFSGQHLLLVALDTVNPTSRVPSPISLLVATDTAANDVTLFDTATQAGARVVHASPDAADPAAANGPVEVWATTNMTDVPLIDTFNYLDIVPAGGTTHVPVAAGDYVFNVGPDVDDINQSVFTSGSLTLGQGWEYTVIASGRLTMAPAFDLLVSADDSRAISGQARVKVAHGAPAAGNVHVYVTAAGAFSVMDVEMGNAGDPLLSDFAFGSITDYVALTPGNYDIRVVPVSSGMVAINDEGRNLAAGSVVTAVARGPDETDSMPNDFDLILLTN